MLYQKTFEVEGICIATTAKNRVEEGVGDIKCVAGKVNLKKGKLTFFYAEEVDDEVIKSRIERTG